MDDNNLTLKIEIVQEDGHCHCHCYFYKFDWCHFGVNSEQFTKHGIPIPSERCPGPGTYRLKLEKIDV